MKLFFFLSIQILLAVILSVSFAFANDENEVFDRQRMTANELLLQSYDNSRILALGESNHNQYRIFEALVDLLKERGTDPDLKYVVLEKSFLDSSLLLKLVSKQTFREVTKKVPFKNFDHYWGFTCAADSGLWILKNLFPLIREINRKRDPENPLIVTGIDSINNDRVQPKQYSVELTKPAKAVECGKEDEYAEFYSSFLASGEREKLTAKNFEHEVLAGLGATGKAIIVYHIFHLIKGVEACTAIIDGKNWVFKWNDFAWFSMFLRKHPYWTKRSKIIAFDSIDDEWATDGSFWFTKRQRNRFAAPTDFSVPMAPFAEVFSPIDVSKIINRSSSMFLREGRTKLPSMALRGQRRLSDMVDGIVWTHSAKRRYDIPDWHKTERELCGLGTLGTIPDLSKVAF